MTILNVDGARCAALFASGLQRSDVPSEAAVAEAVSRTVRQFGIRGCTDRMAQEFGDHPDAAVDRMRWIRQLVGQMQAHSTHPPRAALGLPPDCGHLRAVTRSSPAMPDSAYFLNLATPLTV